MAGDRQFDSAPLTSSPPGAWRPLWQLAQFVAKPMEQFLRIEAASGALLLVAAASALIWANSPASETYVRFWQVPVAVTVGSMTFARTLQWVVNDGLMTVFFFLVGLEIRREIHQGVLSDWQRAALPAAAAAGGMLVPAGLYLLIAGMPTTRTGWGIPMATDIAFALAVMGLLGGRVPPALRVWLLALAVIDDLGSIVVISLFYSSGIATKGLVIAAAGLAALLALKGLGVRTKVAYVLPAVVVWAGIYGAGIHPTIAGVAVGLLTPVRPWLGTEGFRGVLRRELDSMDRDVEVPSPFSDLSGTLRRVGMARREALSPADSLIESLHPWVAFGIMPLFALANAGVQLSVSSFDPTSLRVLIGIAAGLLLGKPVGVLFASWVAIRLGVGVLPAGLRWRHLVVLGLVAGVGFTMSLFVGQLAFFDLRLLAAAKLGVLSASGLAAASALVFGRLLLSRSQEAESREAMKDAGRPPAPQ